MEEKIDGYCFRADSAHAADIGSLSYYAGLCSLPSGGFMLPFKSELYAEFINHIRDMEHLAVKYGLWRVLVQYELLIILGHFQEELAGSLLFAFIDLIWIQFCDSSDLYTYL